MYPAIKRMLLRAHDNILQLIAPEFTWQAEHSPELPSVPRQADLVWEVKSAMRRFLG